MNPARTLLAIALTVAFGAAQAEVIPDADARYIQRIDGRFAGFAGSGPNLERLAIGLRHGTQIKLTGSGETVTLPSTRPMGYGNVTRTLDLASRQLAAIGITEPTPQQISAALNGGTVSAAGGEVNLKGVLRLRGEGMGWGQIAHAIGVHPGMGSAKAPPTPVTGGAGITTAAGHAAGRAGTSSRAGDRPEQLGVRRSVTGGTASSSDPGLRSANSQGSAHANGKGAGRI